MRELDGVSSTMSTRYRQAAGNALTIRADSWHVEETLVARTLGVASSAFSSPAPSKAASARRNDKALTFCARATFSLPAREPGRLPTGKAGRRLDTTHLPDDDAMGFTPTRAECALCCSSIRLRTTRLTPALPRLLFNSSAGVLLIDSCIAGAVVTRGNRILAITAPDAVPKARMKDPEMPGVLR